MKKILVTGGAGFIGSHLVDRLVKEGYGVRVLDNFEPQVHQGRKPDYLNKDAEYIEGDVRDEGALSRAFAGVDCVFHYAAKVGVGQSMYEISDYVSSNTLGTSVLLNHIVNRKVPLEKMIVASSMSIYGEGAYECGRCGAQTPFLRSEGQLKNREWEVKCPACGDVLKPVPTGEDKKLLSTSVYALTKKDQEELCLIVGTSYKIPTVALRFFNVYGPRQSLSNPYTGACAIFSSRIKNNKAPLIYEDGRQTRDFVDVRDIVEAGLIVMKNAKADFGSFNVGTGRATTVLEVASTLAKLYGKDMKSEVVHKYRVGDIRHCYADISRIRALGFSPRYGLAEGLSNLVEWGKTESSEDRTDQADKRLDDFNLKI
ncbi:MAG: NAD-dependent epimerase/dehydratase family protein [Candidatus Omnitrophota bacterium]